MVFTLHSSGEFCEGLMLFGKVAMLVHSNTIHQPFQSICDILFDTYIKNVRLQTCFNLSILKVILSVTSSLCTCYLLLLILLELFEL